MEVSEGTVSLVQVAEKAKRGEAWAIDEALRHPENMFCGGAITRLVMQGNDKVQAALFSRMDNEACLDLVLDLASGRHAQATEAVIRHADNPKCWEALQFFAKRHNEKAVDFILESTLREGGLRCAITLAELPCPKARDYIRDLAGLIRLADRGTPFAKEALQAHKDYGPECRERILRLG